MQAMPASFLTFGLCLSFLGINLLGQTVFSLINYGSSDLSVFENIKKVQLIKQVVKSPQSIENLSNNEINILLSEPSLNRGELSVNAWHYHGESCALDVYFSKNKDKPDYIEYRALSLNEDVQAQYNAIDQSAVNDYCLKDILEAQGVNTPDNYARQPTPSWENPYRT